MILHAAFAVPAGLQLLREQGVSERVHPDIVPGRLAADHTAVDPAQLGLRSCGV